MIPIVNESGSLFVKKLYLAAQQTNIPSIFRRFYKMNMKSLWTLERNNFSSFSKQLTFQKEKFHSPVI